MDNILNFVSDYCTGLTYRSLPSEVVRHAKRRVIDTVGCAVGAYHQQPPRIARAHALKVTSTPGATVLGTRHKTAPELAAFTNGVMARYLDFNDSSMTGNGGHPSDNIMGILAAAEYAGADLQAAITGVVVAYEVQARFAAACNDLRANGWDNAVYMILGATAGVSNALGLSKTQAANAIALAAVANGQMGQTRVGELSMWKACTAPNAARNAVFSVIMAREGLTGPEQAFEGPRGYKKQLGTKLQLDMSSFGGNGRAFAIETDRYKNYPCDYEVQCAVTPALELHALLKGRLAEIETIEIETYAFGVEAAADTPEKWNPISRETADHSLPYVMAVALTRGSVWLDDFDDERVRDPALRPLMNKIKVRATDECNRIWPEAYPFKITVRTKSGDTLYREILYPKGHPKNPLSDADLEAKFLKLTEPVIGKPAASKTLSELWRLETLGSVQNIFDMLVI